ncbi:hypothetical protein FC764_11470 [Clostridium botulinum]|uniref:hypothetical protein n=1 Tax=Clostridium botulinum TaxID=1491 RepID=UPI0013F7C34D|nr:hypothetical protein [Clostridium botulinum]MBN1060013.1 hypothetical protein [Clostridium botulinum]MBN1063159.1 hypothetical protein [Clostridium botulinum]NFF81846.1 hypothetical protein [Clostridium botulinum]NFO13469.1 hypothetical protein [Clostridium botulinum]
MSKTNKCTRIIIIILLMSSIIFSIASTFVNLIVLNKNLYLKLLDKSDAYTKVEDKLYEKMDSLLGSDVDESIKKSIISDEDVKKESEIVLTCILNDLKTGENNKPVIDTNIYKNRVRDVLKSIIGYESPSNNNLSFNDKFNIQNMNFIKSETEHNDILVIDNKFNSNKKSFVFEDLASRAELEAQGRAMLREKGLTESQARQKMAERGISEEQIWNMLKEDGYLDEEDTSDSNNTNSSSKNNESDEKVNQNSKVDKNNEFDQQLEVKEKNLSNGKVKDIIKSVISDKEKSFEEKINSMYDKLSEEAGKFIDVEIEKLTLSKLIDSNLFKVLTSVTSLLHKINLVSIAISIILIVALAKLNNGNIKLTIKIIGQVLMVIGTLFILMLFTSYLIVGYKTINIGPEYLNEVTRLIINKFLTVSLIGSLITLVIGILSYVFSNRICSSK